MAGRVVIVGASGLIGGKVASLLGERAVGTYYRSPRPGLVRFELGRDDPGAFLDGIGEGISHALILGGEVHVDACAKDPVGTALVNVAAVTDFIDAAVAREIVPVFASSDAVYGNGAALSGEEAVRVPIMEYGRQKMAVEEHLAGLSASWLALRFAKVLDPGLAPQGILGPWLESLVFGRQIRCVDDQRFTPVGLDDAGTAIIALMETRVTGVFNVGGPIALSRLDLLEALVAAVSRLRTIEPLITVCTTADLNLREPRPADCSLSVEKLRRAISYAPRSPEELCGAAAATYFSRFN